MKGVRACYPRFFVRAAEMAPSDDWTIFVSFEGQAAERTPMFHGVDVFRFTPDGSKIKQVDVYRSNWQGAKGHAQRKAAAEKAARREDMASDPADLGGHWRA